MKFNCANCGQRLQCGDDWAGRTVKCPQCGEKLDIPAAEETAAEETAAEETAASSTPGKSAAVKRRASARARSAQRQRQQKWSDSTNVSMLISGLIGLGLSVLFYLLLLPFQSFYFGQLFLDRGWVPFVLVLLMNWSVGFLVLKVRKLGSQKNALLLDLLPTTISDEINSETVEDFMDHVNTMPSRLRESFMFNRIRKGLEHFAVRHSNPEVASMMMSQSEIDAGAVHSSYSVVKVFIWAIPILGFIGTVLGISNAVGGFAGALDQAQDIEVLKTSLNGVTSGLAVAFDTTLVALVMSLIVSFPVSIIQKREEDFLGKVDEYCSENLLKRLNDAGGVADVASHTHVMMQALGNAMAQNQGDIVNDLKEAQEQMAAVQAEQIKYFETVAISMDKNADEHRRNVEQNLVLMVENIQGAVSSMTKKINDLVDGQVKSSSQSAEKHQKNIEDLMARISEPVDKAATDYIDKLSEGLDGLNKVLKDLGENQVIIQQAPRWRWFKPRKG